MTRVARGVAILGLVLVAVGCSADGGDDDGSAGSTSATVDSASTAAPEPSVTSSLVASTLSTTTTTTTTGGSTTSTASTSTESTTAPTTTTTSTTAAPSTTEILVIEGGAHEFTSPSGNIACVMTERSASCWISEKNWTIEQPDGPDCDVSDWGNVVEVTAEGASYPCYTDFGWNLSAPAMAYGTAVELGPFRCDSAQTGVTCRHSSGAGFSLARASVRVL